MKRAVLVLALLVCAAPALAGLTYDFSSVTSSGRSGSTLAGTAAVEGKNMRISFTSGDGLVFRSNTVLISKDGGRNFVVLDPEKKTYYDFSLEELMKTAGNVMKSMGGMFQITLSNQSMNTKDLGMAEPIEGYETKKMVVTSSYDLALKIMGTTTKSHVDTVTETWYTTRIPVEYVTFVQQKGMKTGFDEVDKLIEAHGVTSKGFPLKQIVTTKSTSGKKSETGVITTTISKIRNGAVAASSFDIPADYKREEQPPLGIPGMPKMQ